jgi:spoIIIJ-associated protein
MESLEARGKTVEEATESALQQLGLTRDQVEITVLSKGRSGFLGMGAEEAVVRVAPLAEVAQGSGDSARIAREALEELLRMMKLDARVELVSDVEVEESAESEVQPIALEVKGDDLGILIGRRGETLAALQYVVRLIVAHHEKARVPLTIDVEGYKQRRYHSLRELALRLAEKAVSTRQSMTLEPMPADERRIVHLALSVNPDVVTQSVGEGEMRKVMIMPQKRGT